MGFMNKLNKMKNFLFDEEEDEDKPVKKQAKKVIKKEEVSKKSFDDDFSKTQEIENLYLEDLSDPEPDVKPEIKSRVVKNEPEFKFPEFNDDDFAVSKERIEPIIPIKKEEPKPVLYQGSKRKEETKKFKPSPMISPVYGLLDEDGKKTKKVSSEPKVKEKIKDDITFEEVRRKAYGPIDEEIENTLKRLSNKTIEEAEREMEENEIKLSRAEDKSKKMVKEEKPVVVPADDDDDDDMILPNIKFKEIDIDEERNKNIKEKVKQSSKSYEEDDDDDDTKEQDLFNLIDTMYQREEKRGLMEAFLSAYLPILIYILLCILIVLLIIICVKVIKTMNRVGDIVEDVDEKVKSLNGVFSIVDNVTDKLSALTEVISDSIILFVKGIFRRKKRKMEKEIESEENYEED